MAFGDQRSLLIIHHRLLRALATALTIPTLVLVLTGCGAAAEVARGGGEERSTLTVLAASSLTDAFGELEKTFEEQNPDVGVRQSFESSSTLRVQIQ